ncbi:MAG: Gfo/Idh/MocA family oxidoreductase [Planctomycetaceae bacterium]
MQRRQFLQACATATACTVTTTYARSPAERIKMGQIGTKHAHAGGQLSTARQLSDLYEVVGVVEPDDQQYARIAQQPTYRDVPRLTLDQLLGTPGLQVVAVETEVRDLLRTARICLEAGLHIHLDKPAGESYEELVALHRLAEGKKRVIQMGYMFRYNLGFQFLFEIAREGWLGNIFEVHGVMSKKIGPAERSQLAEYPGGSMFELGCHLIDPLFHLLGTPDNVVPFNRGTLSGDPLLDNMLAVFEYPRATATIRSSLQEVDGGRAPTVCRVATRGPLIRPLEPPVLELTSKPPRQFPQGSSTGESRSSAGRYHGAWMELARVVRGEIPFPYSHSHDLAVQQAVLAASGLLAWQTL